MNDPGDPLDWAAKAENDLKLMRSAMRHKEPITDGACFHAQQCAEKYLKAILVEKNKSFPKTHDLVALSELCESVGVIVPVDADRLEMLSNYAVQARYPSAVPTREDARSAIASAQSIRKFVRKILSV